MDPHFENEWISYSIFGKLRPRPRPWTKYLSVQSIEFLWKLPNIFTVGC